MRQVQVEFHVAKRDCPEGDWQPTIHRTSDGHIWCVSVWPRPFGENVPGVPGGRLDGALRGTWIAPLGSMVLVLPGQQVVAEKEESGEVVTVRLVRLAE